MALQQANSQAMGLGFDAEQTRKLSIVSEIVPAMWLHDLYHPHKMISPSLYLFRHHRLRRIIL